MDLFEVVKCSYEVVGQSMSDGQLQMIVTELETYPREGVDKALARCRRELRKLTLTDILDRIPGGRPGVEEAWALLSPSLNNEQISIAWTDEMREAYGVAALLAEDPVAARMAFKEKYVALVHEARAFKFPLHWSVSLGHDVGGRTAALQLAVARNQVSQAYAQKLLPAGNETDLAMDLVNIGHWPGGKI